jgi:hypothetical protein
VGFYELVEFVDERHPVRGVSQLSVRRPDEAGAEECRAQLAQGDVGLSLDVPGQLMHGSRESGETRRLFHKGQKNHVFLPVR